MLFGLGHKKIKNTDLNIDIDIDRCRYRYTYEYKAYKYSPKPQQHFMHSTVKAPYVKSCSPLPQILHAALKNRLQETWTMAYAVQKGCGYTSIALPSGSGQ